MASILGKETSLLALVALHFHDRCWCNESCRFLATWFITNRWGAWISWRCNSPSSMVLHHKILRQGWCRAISQNGMLVHPGCFGHDCLNTQKKEPRLLESNGLFFGAPTTSWRYSGGLHRGGHASGWNAAGFFLADFQGEKCLSRAHSAFEVDHWIRTEPEVEPIS